VVAALVVVGGIGWNALQAWRQGWAAEGDAALIALRTDDVLSTHPPLLGNPTTAGTDAAQDAHHPGPLEFALLAIPLRSLAPSADGLLVGTALVNGAAVALTVWFACRRAGPSGGLVAAVGLAILVYGLGQEVPHDAYNPHVVLLPLALLVTLTWASIDGDRLALPAAVAAGSLIAQSHAYETLVVAGFAAAVGAALAARWWRARDRPEATTDGRLRPWLLISGGVGLLLWLPPIIDQITHRPGNLRLLLQEGTSSGQPTEGLRFALDRLADAITPPFRFLTRQPTFVELHSRADGVRLVGAALVIGALGAVSAVAWRRRRPAVAWLGVVALAGLAISTFVTARLPQGSASLSPYNHRHWWITGLFAWLALTVGAVSSLGLAAGRRRPRLDVAAALLVAVAIVVPGSRTSIGDDRGSASFGADEAIDIITTPDRSPAGKATRHSPELNGPMIAITLSSSASLRTPTTACSGLPAVSNETILSFLPPTPPAALISSTAICAAISLVLASVAKGPAPAKRFPSRISCACAV